MEKKKYQIRHDLIKQVNGRTLYRIEALRSFKNVKKWELGGYVESEDNLAQEGDCWVYDYACAFEHCHVEDNAMVCDNAMVFGKTIVGTDAIVCNNAKIFDTVVVKKAVVRNNAKIYGDARINSYGKACCCAQIYDNVRICGNADIEGNVTIKDNALIYGNVHIFGNAQICSCTPS